MNENTYYPQFPVVKPYLGALAGSVGLDIPYSFARGDSRAAVCRKLNRMAVKLHLRLAFGEACVFIRSRKDEERLNQLLVYANGKAVGKTARNNYGRHNAQRREEDKL